MTLTQDQQPLIGALLRKRALMGAGIALALISIFLLGTGEPNPSWPELWFIRPLLVVSFAGATGGAVYHLLNSPFYSNDWVRFAAKAVSLLVYVIGLWMGFVLGLAGTMWD